MHNNPNNTTANLFTKTDIYICLFILISTIAVYWQAKDLSFISQFDDALYVKDNLDVIQGLTGDSLKRAFRFTVKSDEMYWHPITLLSHMMDVSLFGLNPGGHHLVNVFFHILNAFLLFLFFRKYTGNRWRSAFVTVLFVLHPLNVDSVAWIAERKSVLSSCFWFMGILLYGFYTKKPRVVTYLLLFACMLMGLLTKPLLVVMPCTLFLLDYWPLRRFRFDQSLSVRFLLQLIFEKIPLFILSGIWIYVSSLSIRLGELSVDYSSRGLGLRLANAVVSYVKYLLKVIWPFKLAVYYPYPQSMLPLWQTVGAIVLLIVISIFAVFFIRRKPWLFVGWFWFMGTLIPVSGIMQNGLWPAMADRWMYVPIVGILMITAWGIFDLLSKWERKKNGIAILLFVFLPIIMLVSKKQVSYWSNGETLFAHALEVTALNVESLSRLATAQLEAGKFDQAEKNLKKLVAVMPNHEEAQYLLSFCYFKQGRVGDAVLQIERGLIINPGSEKSFILLGRCYLMEGKTEKAAEQFRKVIQLSPGSKGAHEGMALAMVEKGDTQKAIEYYRKAIELNNRSFRIYNSLGLIYAEAGNDREAIACFSKAIDINKYFAEAHNNLATIFEKTEQLDKAESHYRKAVAFDPGYAQAYSNLGAFLAVKRERHDEAIKNLNKAILIDPGYVEALNNLGLVLERQGKEEAAIRQYKKILEIKHDSVEAHNNIGALYYYLKRYEKAVYHFQEAAHAAPDRLDVRHNLDKAKSKIVGIGGG